MISKLETGRNSAWKPDFTITRHNTPGLCRPQRTLSRNPLSGPLVGSAAKTSLPCPGEEAPPRPKSLVGVGTRGPQVIALAPKGGPGLRFPPRSGATKPSRPVGREAEAATKDPGRGHEPGAAAWVGRGLCNSVVFFL